MGFSDLVIAAVLVVGCCYILYRSLWQKKGHCPGCDGGCDRSH
ncbi:FeoB-associated Cys-rich membrane protein [Geomesophilobacter sediminis]|uniref:FeoB-associated Cys-rich membrane protein n=1 Tax=Geomesophilobacter sediminis TaxID=2798584 RepID=A0A8J7JDT7_9BACT|nr:FeoB-associated Cys-rich membrane protein [Geomesophilobacter sediminis]MBJ6723894.1 FeoB-associated Cys-rich membrane protein [Geomesophilobacter sediminis]